MNTIGNKLLKIDFLKGFAICYATGLSVTIGSLNGIPLSSTHCVVGACAGIYFAGNCGTLKRVYTLAKSVDAEDEVDVKFVGNDFEIVFASYQEPVDTLRIELKTIKDIIVWCLITIPCSFAFSALTCLILTKSFL